MRGAEWSREPGAQLAGRASSTLDGEDDVDLRVLGGAVTLRQSDSGVVAPKERRQGRAL